MYHKVARILFCFGFIFCTSKLAAQIFEHEFQNNFTHLNTQNGLSSDFVNQICKDPLGYMWIATQNGLNRYDGKHIKNYYHKSNDSNSILHNNTSAIMCDSKGRIWIGHAGKGISVLHVYTQKIIRYYVDDKKNNWIKNFDNIAYFFEDHNHQIWIASWGSGIYKYNEETNDFTQFVADKKNPNALFNNKTKCITQDLQKNYWVGLWAEGPGNENGLMQFNPTTKTFRFFKDIYFEKFKEELSAECRSIIKFVHDIYIDKNNTAWISGFLGVAKINLNNLTYKTYKLQDTKNNFTINAKTARCIIQNSENQFLIGTIGGGINELLLTENTFNYCVSIANKESSLSNNSIRHIYKDNNGVLFIATIGGGVNIQIPTKTQLKFSPYTDFSLNGTFISSGILGSKNIDDDWYFIGKFGLIKHVNDGKTKPVFFSHPDWQHSNFTAYKFLPFQDKNVLLISTTHGLFCFNLLTQKVEKKNIINQSAEEYKFENINTAISWNTDTSLVLNEYNCLYWIDWKKNIATHIAIKGPNFGFWKCMIRINKEELLIGFQNGIIKYNVIKGTINYIMREKIPDKKIIGYNVNSIFQDHKNRIWFTSDSGLGLIQLPKKSITFFTIIKNEQIQELNKLFVDKYNNFWLNSDFDYYFFNTKYFTFEPIENRFKQSNHSIYNQSEFTEYADFLLQGSEDGIYTLEKTLIYNNVLLPAIKIGDFRLKDKVFVSDSIVQLKQEVFLNYNENSFEIDIANFDYEKNRFYRLEYQLEGYDENWRLLEDNGTLRFNNLEPGKYTLHVRYKNVQTNDKNLNFTINIAKPFYKTWWFYLLCLLLLSAIIYFYIQYKTKQLQSQNKILEEKVEARTLDLKLEKQKSDDLLLNILPEDIANELKTKGVSEAKLHENVSVIFTDFINFTGISETLSPTELVAEIDKNFKAFDYIMEKYGIEKIKTIGDAYLAVSGLPLFNENHALNAVLACKEIIEYIQHNETKFSIRIGINTGPVVAGIVGVKKFAYDIWGDTVNTANRIESAGESNKINISESTYKLIKNNFNTIDRGKIATKGKGELNMYYVE